MLQSILLYCIKKFIQVYEVVLMAKIDTSVCWFIEYKLVPIILDRTSAMCVKIFKFDVETIMLTMAQNWVF